MGKAINWKNIKSDMTYLYNNDSEGYDKLWSSIRFLAAMNYDNATEIFLKMVKYDNELYFSDNAEI